MRKNILLTILSAVVLAFSSCASDDDFSSDNNLLLTFSSDTINFDTVFTTLGSATKQFRIYNRNNQSLTIQSIELMNASESGFRMNIDGEKGTRLTDVEILKKDSLFGFLEVTVNPSSSNSPVLIRDSIRFVTNGSIQYIQLEAVGQDVYMWKGATITSDSVLTNTKPFLIYDSMVINRGITVTMERGVRLFFRNKASLQVYGCLQANGTINEPVVFRGARFDKIEGNIPYDNVPGQWDGVYFYPESYDNALTNVHLRNAGKGITFYASGAQKKKALLTNTVVHNTVTYGVLATNCNIEAVNCLFSNSQGPLLAINGGEYYFLHCTLANYFAWGYRTYPSLILSNYADIGKESPLGKCDFINTILYGDMNTELSLEEISGNSPFNYTFVNCLIKGKEAEDSHYVNTIWNKDPLFKDINSEKIYSYSFELQPASPAIGNADKSYSMSAPFDMKGVSRLTDGRNPDIGCYELAE